MLSTHWFCLMRFISWDTLIKMQNNPLWKGLTFPQRPRWGQFSSDSCQPLHFPGNLFMPPLPCFSLKFSALAHCSSCSSGSHKGKTKKQFLSQPLFFKKIDQPPGLHLPIMVCCRLKRRMFGHPAKKKKIKERNVPAGLFSPASLGGRGGRTVKWFWTLAFKPVWVELVLHLICVSLCTLFHLSMSVSSWVKWE